MAEPKPSPTILTATRLEQAAALLRALAPLIDSLDGIPSAAPAALAASPTAGGSGVATSLADPPAGGGGRGSKFKAIEEFLKANPEAEVDAIVAAVGCSRSHAHMTRGKIFGLKKK